MAIDSNGAYYPSFGDVSYPPSTRGTLRHGSGAPADSLGSDGDAYSDADSPGTFYSRSGGTWTLITGSGGAGGLVGVVSPEGVVTANPGTPYINTALKELWWKESGTGNTGWTQYV